MIQLHLVVGSTLVMVAVAPETDEQSEDWLGIQIQQCSKIKQCYCIKGTICGWCEAPQHHDYEGAYVGISNKPWHKTCPHWHNQAASCPDLICDHHYTVRARLARFSSIPCLALLFWLRVWRRHLRNRFQERSARKKAAAIAVEMADLDLERLTSFHSMGKTETRRHHQKSYDSEYFGPIRTYRSFRKGADCPVVERLPTTTERPYQRNIEEIRKALGFQLCATMQVALQRDVALGSTLFDTSTLVLLAACSIGSLRAAAAFMSRDNYNFMCNILNEICNQVDVLTHMVTLLLSFYALGRIGWWWAIQSEGFKIQGRLHDIAMIAGTRKPTTEEHWEQHYQLYRWLTVSFFLAYRPLVPRFASLDNFALPQLKSCGLLTSEEVDIMEKAHRGPLPVVESWIADWVEQHLQKEARHAAFESVKEMRSHLAGVDDLTAQRAPVSFESLLYVTVYALCIMLPFGPAHFNLHDREYIANNYHIAPVVGVFLKSSFFLSLLYMLRSLQTPFGREEEEHGDAFHPEAIMLSTERKLRDYMTSERAPAAPNARG